MRVGMGGTNVLPPEKSLLSPTSRTSSSSSSTSSSSSRSWTMLGCTGAAARFFLLSLLEPRRSSMENLCLMPTPLPPHLDIDEAVMAFVSGVLTKSPSMARKISLCSAICFPLGLLLGTVVVHPRRVPEKRKIITQTIPPCRRS